MMYDSINMGFFVHVAVDFGAEDLSDILDSVFHLPILLKSFQNIDSLLHMFHL